MVGYWTCIFKKNINSKMSANVQWQLLTIMCIASVLKEIGQCFNLVICFVTGVARPELKALVCIRYCASSSVKPSVFY